MLDQKIMLLAKFMLTQWIVNLLTSLQLVRQIVLDVFLTGRTVIITSLANTAQKS